MARKTIENVRDFSSPSARSHAKRRLIDSGAANHFRMWRDNRRSNPFVLSFKRVKGDCVTHISCPVPHPFKGVAV